MVALFTVFIVQLLPHFVLTTDLFTYNGLYGHIRPKIDLVNSKRAVEDLLIRLIGKEKAKSFVIKIDPQLRINDRNVFSLKKRKNSNTIRIKGTTGVEAAMGFHHYMKEYCNSHVSWDGDNINIPRELPDVNFHLIVPILSKYLFNVLQFRMVGLGQMGERNRLDGFEWFQLSVGRHGARGNLEKNLFQIGDDV